MEKKYLFPFLSLFFFSSIFPKEINNFNQTKSILSRINRNTPGSFYCGCKIIWKGKKGIPDLSSCGYQIRKNFSRANRIEWEHVVPAWFFGHNLKCWKNGGRKKCNKDLIYKKMENDLHNLQPVIGEINNDRGNYQYSQWKGKSHQYGKCEIKIDFKNKKVEPPERSRGSIARTYLYMKDRYHLKLSKSRIRLFKIWNKKYPASFWECRRNNIIASIQGNDNPYVSKICNLKFSSLHNRNK